MSMTAIRIEGLRVTAGRKDILDLDQLTVANHEVFAVIGPNGAGKSTLLTSCLGLVRPQAGQVWILGEPLHECGGAARVGLRRRIGYVAQNLAGRSELPLTTREVVAIGRTGVVGLLRPLRASDWCLVDEWMERLGIAGLADQGYAELSGGEQRKALIARAMVQQPELLLLDEPTAHLDLGWREQIVRTLESLHARTRLTVVLVCHEMEVIPPSCKRMALLESGRITAQGTPEEVLTAERIARLYGPGLSVMHAAARHAIIPAGGGRS
ncbi:MAG: ABC transporter ATP-binding protein [Phycisphaerales bacterium]|nr:ABC transporter ATP-binding protein [Phycisphaerales bacterium]